MMKRTLRNLALFFACASMSASVLAADPAAKKGYLTDSANDVVKSGFGLCWHTGFWTPADAIDGCDGMLKKKAGGNALATPLPGPGPAAAVEMTPPVYADSNTDNASSSAVSNSNSNSSDTGSATATTTTTNNNITPGSDKLTFEADAFFDFDKSVLKAAGKDKLADLASKLQGTDIEVVVATGHTDAIGTERYNIKLSLRRANAVKAFLVSKGIPADRIFTEGKGESQPVASNKTREGRAKNRRVEVEVVSRKK